MANMRDVAEKAGVSISTVSHVVNETRFVSEETRNKVIAAMDALSYQPNRLARSLRRKDKRTHTLGLLIPDNMNPFFAEVSRGIEDASFAANYNVFLCNSDNHPEKELDYIEVLVGKQIDGIILVSTGTTDSLKLLKRRKIKVVVVDRQIGETNYDSVMLDNDLGGYLATKYLIELGHERIGCITGPSSLTPSGNRVQAYRRALEEAHIPIDESLILQGDFRSQSGYLQMTKLLNLSTSPTAIFACNDMMAVGVIRAINEQNLKVPEDISVIGFDDIALTSYLTPKLTTIVQPSYEMGMVAAEILIERIQSPNASPINEVLLPSLAERESCRAI